MTNETTIKIYCECCKKEVNAKITKGKETFKVFGENVEINSKYLKCPKCGEKIYYINILTRTEKAERDSARRPEKIDSDEILHSPLIAKDITLDGTNCIKTQYIDFSGKPIANEWCRIYIYQGDETFEILTKTDDNGWIYITNLPDGTYDIDIEGDA